MNARIVALILGALLLLLGALVASNVAHYGHLQGNPLGPLPQLVKGSLGTAPGLTQSLANTTPLLLAGAAVFLALRAGLFNIGAEGQFLVGALACTAVALRLPGVVGIVLGTLAAVLAGALWAYPAGAIKAYRGGHEVITTIMLNNLAVLFTDYLVIGPLRASGGDTTTPSLDASSRLPNVVQSGAFSVNVALPVALALALALGWWLRRTVAGYELRAVGANPTAARYAGVDPKRTIVRAMLASGAIAGFAGAVQVLAYEGRFYTGFSPGYGFDALGVALLAGGSAIALVPAAFLFGALAKGALALQMEGVPKGITTVVLAMLILIAAAVRSRGVRKVA